MIKGARGIQVYANVNVTCGASQDNIYSKYNIDNDNTITYAFIGLFSVLYLLGLFAFACLLILSGLKVKNNLKINVLIIKHIKMDIKSLEIKAKTNYN